MGSEQLPSETTRVGAEIERKFLLRASDLGPKVTAGLPGTTITQGYFTRIDGWSVRLRLSAEENGLVHAWLTLKTTRQGSVRQEIERSILPDFAKRLLGPQDSGRLIRKTRYRLPQQDLVWEIDRFLGRHEGLWVAEIELPDPDHPFERPDWLGAEVTYNPAYRNEAMTAIEGRSSRMTAPAELVSAVRELLRETGKSAPRPEPRERDARLAAKLRVNLLRRKQQARSRDEAVSPGPTDAGKAAPLDREDGSA